mgnify:CR=1 FL=1
MEHFKSMGRLRFRLFLFVTWVYSVVGVSLGGLLNTIWHTHYFAWFPAIPIYFYLLCLVLLVFLEKEAVLHLSSLVHLLQQAHHHLL